MKLKALLLNPPGDRLYIRDYYCGKTSKSNYLFHPIDLLMLSGRLSEKYEVSLIDAIVEGTGIEECLRRIVESDAEIIIFLSAEVSWAEDIRFFKRLAEKKRCRLIGTGDIFLADGYELLKEHAFIEACVLDFSSEALMRYLEGKRKNLYNMIYRDGEGIVSTPIDRPQKEEFIMPVPRHDLFLALNYRFPFVKHRPFATVLTDFGCPYKCSFCIMPTLGFRYRPVSNVMEELYYLKGLGVKEIFFIDQTFGAIRDRNIELCRKLIEDRFNFGWVSYSRVDGVDEEMLKIMKDAGCHTIIFGVETANNDILKKYNKGYTKEQVQHTFERAHRLGIRTVGTFIMGLPEETETSCMETLEFAKTLKCDFASFNFAVAKVNTLLKKTAIEKGLIKEKFPTGDQSGSCITMPSMYLSREKLTELRERVVKGFYLRPSYLFGKILDISTLYELREWFVEGIGLLQNIKRRDKI